MRGVSDTFTQGGQTQLHKIRMISQVLSSTLKVSLWISLVVLLILLVYDRGWEQIIYLVTYYKAVFRESLKFLPYGFLDSSWVLHRDGNYYEIHDHILVNRPEYVVAATASRMMLVKTLMQTFMVFLISMVVLFAYWIHRGRALKIKDVISGSTDVPLEDLIRCIKKDKKASDIMLSGLPLIKDSETKHMLQELFEGTVDSQIARQQNQTTRRAGDIRAQQQGIIDKVNSEKGKSVVVTAAKKVVDEIQN